MIFPPHLQPYFEPYRTVEKYYFALRLWVAALSIPYCTRKFMAVCRIWYGAQP
jgi:hypothetical protein